MQPDYSIHDRKYQEARAKGWEGWGGPDRLAKAYVWIDRLFSYDGVPKSGRTLDLGCGEGNYTRLLAQKGYNVIGVDISATAIAWAKEKSAHADDGICYFQKDLTKPDLLLGQSFDLITDGNCLHCIIGLDRQVFLTNVRRLLSSHGVFFISTLCSNTRDDKYVKLEGKSYRFAPTQANLHHELKAAGFRIEKSAYHVGETTAHKKDGLNHCTVHASRIDGAVV